MELRDPRRLHPLPLTPAWLDAFRLDARRKLRASMVGSQLNRRQGQSREFLELAPYTFGDDVRTIDWRASQRYKLPQDLLVRKTMAEEHYRLVISIDTRATMLLPEPLPKVQLALWLAQAYGWMALQGGHAVWVHRLFGARAGSVFALKGAQGQRLLPGALRAIYRQPVDEQPNLADLPQLLPPAAIWLILTDLYFADPAQDAAHFVGDVASQIARRIAAAQSGWRWVVLVDIDSWACEVQALLGAPAVELEGFGLPPGRHLYELDPALLAGRQAAIREYKATFFALSKLQEGSRVHWPYPRGDIQAATYWQPLLRDGLRREQVLQRLLMEATG